MKNKLYIIGILFLIILSIVIIHKTNEIQIILVLDNEIYKEIHIQKNMVLDKIEIPKKEGYAFVGFYDEENNSLEENKKQEKSKVYYGKWAKIVKKEETDE